MCATQCQGAWEGTGSCVRLPPCYQAAAGSQNIFSVGGADGEALRQEAVQAAAAVRQAEDEHAAACHGLTEVRAAADASRTAVARLNRSAAPPSCGSCHKSHINSQSSMAACACCAIC